MNHMKKVWNKIGYISGESLSDGPDEVPEDTDTVLSGSDSGVQNDTGLSTVHSVLHSTESSSVSPTLSASNRASSQPVTGSQESVEQSPGSQGKEYNANQMA